jgi:S-adenosylmethionine:tRNA ribosyltransferase-isomerase
VKAATWPRAHREEERLLVVDGGSGAFVDARVADLPRHLRKGDLLVLNDAATFPASLRASRLGDDAGAPAFEARLVRRGAAFRTPTSDAPDLWTAALLGPGDHRTRTEDRPPPPTLASGDRLVLGGADAALHARVVATAPFSPGLVLLAFDETGAAFWRTLYAVGHPVQYAYVPAPLAVWHVQTAYAGRPLAAEMPSAGRPLTWNLLGTLRRRGIRIATLTHATGLSSTGDVRIDARLPLREAYEIPQGTARAVVATRREGGRVVAVGTSVVRALESATTRDPATGGVRVRAGVGETELVIGPAHELLAVDALFTGMHERGASHFDLLRAFASESALARAYTHAEDEYLQHEFGDSMLLTRRPA